MNIRIVQNLMLASLVILCPWANVVGQTKKNNPPSAPESVLPANAAFQFRYDGTAAHAAAWKKSAAYKALITSEFYSEVKGWAVKLGGDQPFVQPAEKLLDHILTQGLVVGASVKPGEGDEPEHASATVLMNGATIQKDLEALLRLAGATISAPDRKGVYTVSSMIMGPASNSAGLNLVTFGPHLAITSGSDAFITHPRTDPPARIATSLKANAAAGEPLANMWVDVHQLVEAFGAVELPPGPNSANQTPATVREMLAILGVESVQQLTSQSGLNGPACWNSTRLEYTGPRTGLLTIWNGPTFQLKDLPPLPEATPSFYAGSLDWAAMYAAVWEILGKVAERVGPPEAMAELEREYTQMQNAIGFQIKEDLIYALGAKHVIYADSANAIAGVGAGLCIEVKDAAKLQRVVDAIVAQVPVGRGCPQIVRSKKYGRDLLSVGQQGLPMLPTLCIDKDWIIIALTPQMV